ncbi:response regulator [Azohydromonas lata]|uniref:Response regulator n=1 Tax=Azohydromonas lata TaxID=45677 RepID=A0ABU5IQ05_9BURK|nr:response regulator [Azohydromonas lata]MDZ5460978.1 response regulator [Azohydromonas lata]
MKEVPLALVVDDNALNGRLASALLHRLGWQAQVAQDGPQALELLERQRFDLLLLDLRMPSLDGAEVCRRVRKELRLSSLPVVAYTAHGLRQERADLCAAGFDDLLPKPTTFDDMQQLCRKYAPEVSL